MRDDHTLRCGSGCVDVVMVFSSRSIRESSLVCKDCSSIETSDHVCNDEVLYCRDAVLVKSAYSRPVRDTTYISTTVRQHSRA